MNGDENGDIGRTGEIGEGTDRVGKRVKESVGTQVNTSDKLSSAFENPRFRNTFPVQTGRYISDRIRRQQ